MKELLGLPPGGGAGGRTLGFVSFADKLAGGKAATKDKYSV